MKIKICGITNITDAEYAIKKGATHLGFILYSKSPRYCSPKTVAKIIATIPNSIITVGVFVNDSVNVINSVVEQTGLTCVQLHGSESIKVCQQITVPVIKAFRVATAANLNEICNYVGFVDTILLDTYVAGQSGGTGQTFNWNLAVMSKQWNIPLFLSGGLTPENVIDAIQFVQPYGVDVASGTEQSPGKKSQDKLSKFIQSIKSLEKN